MQTQSTGAPFRSSIPQILFAAALASGILSVSAQEPIALRTGELPPESPYVTVPLDPVANDSMPVSFPSDRVQVQGIPFDFVKKGGVTDLFLKPIGWSAARNESAEYPSYIANYDNRATQTNNRARAIVTVPVSDYAAFWLLAAADDDTNLSSVVTFRLGVMEGQARVVYHDVTATIPRFHDAKTGPGVMRTLPTAAGNLYLVRVPFARAIKQDFKERQFLDLDITKELRVAINQPDPNRFQLRPLGAPSGVHIYALTLERAAVEMEASGAEPGNVFNEPETPAFHLELRNARNEHWIPYTIQTIAECDTGVVTTNTAPDEYRVAAWAYLNPVTHRTVAVPVKERGIYRLWIRLLRDGAVAAYRETTFALLAPDTRKYRAEAPFGTWDFGGGHITPSDPDLLGPLYVKAGLRYGLSSSFIHESERKKYGILNGGDARIRGTNDVQYYVEAMKKDPSLPAPQRFLIFHETGISGEHLTRAPDMFTGRPPYVLNAEEQKTFTNLWLEAGTSFRAIRAAFPRSDIYMFNTVPHLVEEFVRNHWPRELLDKVGNESGNFMRSPEAQPLDFVGNNAGIWMMRQILDHYGYTDVPVVQCLEMCYPDSNPGNLSERTQAAYLVRHLMHSLAWRIPVIRPMCISDVGNSYYWSNWGAAGLLHAWPNVSPKPAYVAYATLSQALDGAAFVRMVPTGSTVVYAFEFRKKNKTCVTCLWTLRGKRQLTIEVPGARRQELTDFMGRASQVVFKDRKAQIEVSGEPVYLATDRPIASILPGAATMEGRPAGKSFVISPLDKLADWTVEDGRDQELEIYNFMNPRRKGDFQYREVGDEGSGKGGLEIKPKLPVEGSSYLPMYSALRLTKPVEIPGEPTEIGLMVNGNGGWGRVIFELEDASGQRWTSIGAEQQGAPMKWMESWVGKEAFAKLNPKTMNVSDWNSDDAWGRSTINFEGWRYVRFPLPGQYPGEGYHWPMNSQWRASGDGVVRYPLKFRRLIVAVPEKILYGTQYIPVANRAFVVSDLMVTYDPAETVFATAQ